MEIVDYLINMLSQGAIYVPAFLFVLTVVVFFHELGHFLAARWCGITVRAFSVGFGPEIFGFNDRYGTRWRLAWIPLGGYVKFLDDVNAASVPDREALEQMSEEEKAGAFQNKLLSQRSFVVAAGPIANFVLATVIYAGLFTFVGQRVLEPRVDKVVAGSPAAVAGFKIGDLIVGVDGEQIESFGEFQRLEAINADQELHITVLRDEKRVELVAVPERKLKKGPLGDSTPLGVLGIERVFRPLVDRVTPNSAADRSGFKSNDLILKINGDAVDSFSEMQRIVGQSAGKKLQVILLRDGAHISLSATPDRVEARDASGQMVARGLLGIQRKDESVLERYNPVIAVWMGAKETYLIASHTLTYLGKIIKGQESAEQLGGPIRIAQVSGQVAQLGFGALLGLTALLSVSIGLLNLFPIPILDGGHLLYYLIEAIRGRPLSPRIQEIGFRIGLALIIMLMIFVTRNDLISTSFLN